MHEPFGPPYPLPQALRRLHASCLIARRCRIARCAGAGDRDGRHQPRRVRRDLQPVPGSVPRPIRAAAHSHAGAFPHVGSADDRHRARWHAGLLDRRGRLGVERCLAKWLRGTREQCAVAVGSNAARTRGARRHRVRCYSEKRPLGCACAAWICCSAGEREYLWPPCSFVQPNGGIGVSVAEGVAVKTVPVRICCNLKAPTVSPPRPAGILVAVVMIRLVIACKRKPASKRKSSRAFTCRTLLAEGALAGAGVWRRGVRSASRAHGTRARARHATCQVEGFCSQKPHATGYILH
jgi:hypothetical protein